MTTTPTQFQIEFDRAFIKGGKRSELEGAMAFAAEISRKHRTGGNIKNERGTVLWRFHLDGGPLESVCFTGVKS